MARSHAAPVTRRSFSRLENPLEVPHLIDIQRLSFEHLTRPKEGLLRETIDDISPIEDYTGSLAIVFGSFEFDQPGHSVAECREKDITYSRPLNVKVAFQNRETGEIREQTVFMGDFPWMTERGTFIINGTERVVVTQLVRSPGAYVMEPKDREKQVFIANLMPARGSWLELEIDKKGRVYARIDRKRKLPVTVLLRAMGFVEDKEILELFDNSVYIRNTIRKWAPVRLDDPYGCNRAVEQVRRISLSSTKPIARSSTVTGSLRLPCDARVDAPFLVDLELEPGAARQHQVGDETCFLAVSFGSIT